MMLIFYYDFLNRPLYILSLNVIVICLLSLRSKMVDTADVFEVVDLARIYQTSVEKHALYRMADFNSRNTIDDLVCTPRCHCSMQGNHPPPPPQLFIIILQTTPYPPLYYFQKKLSPPPPIIIILVWIPPPIFIF